MIGLKKLMGWKELKPIRQNYYTLYPLNKGDKYEVKVVDVEDETNQGVFKVSAKSKAEIVRAVMSLHYGDAE